MVPLSDYFCLQSILQINKSDKWSLMSAQPSLTDAQDMTNKILIGLAWNNKKYDNR